MHGSQAQSAHVWQFSPQAGSQDPLPQFDVITPARQV